MPEDAAGAAVASGTAAPAVPKAVVEQVSEAVVTTQRQLGLAALGTRETTFMEAHPECQLESDDEDEIHSCRIHGRFTALPTGEQCEDGCTWWIYTFRGGGLVGAEISREVFDSSGEYFARFRDDAEIVAQAMEREFGPPTLDQPIAEKSWADVEAAEHLDYDERILIHRRVWERDGSRIEWWLGGSPGHHPGAVLNVKSTTR